MRYVFLLVVVLFVLAPQSAFAAPGQSGDVCRNTAPECDTGLECNNGTCTAPCGGPGQRCCQTTNPQQLCDINYSVAFQNLICSNVPNPASGVCQAVSCGNVGQTCCTSGTACKNSATCQNSVCVNTGTTPNASQSAGQIVVPADPDAKDYFSPGFPSMIVQAAVFVVILAAIFSVIK